MRPAIDAVIPMISSLREKPCRLHEVQGKLGDDASTPFVARLLSPVLNSDQCAGENFRYVVSVTKDIGARCGLLPSMPSSAHLCFGVVDILRCVFMFSCFMSATVCISR